MRRDELAGQDQNRSFILRSIDDLDRERAVGDLSEEDYHELRAKYDRRLDALDGIPDEREVVPTPRRHKSLARQALPVAAVLSVAIGLGLFVARSAGLRLPSQTITGGNDSPTQLLADARGALGTDRPGALRRFRQVLEVQPDNVEARTYAAWITRLDTKAAVDSGKTDAATARPIFVATDAEFERAATTQPDYADPRCFQSVLRFRDLNDAARAHEAYRGCLSANPNQTVAGLVSKLGPEIEQALAADPDPIVSGLAKARIATAANNIRDALAGYDAVVKIDTKNAEARSSSSWLAAKSIATLVNAGQLTDEIGSQQLVKVESTVDVIRVDAPTYPDAACLKVVLADHRGDTSSATAALPTCRAGVATPDLRSAAAQTALPPATSGTTTP